MVGELIAGRYALEELVGSGGMSAVYRAHDRLLERDVALKLLHSSYLEDEEAVERFRREAQAVARLSHPNVVTVIDRGEEEGRQFIVFEYVPGRTLKDHLERLGPLPPEEALRVVIDVGEGLAYAHAQGIVHRDVKPQNVILNGSGSAKVTDFGIARSVDVEKGVTQTGTVIGTGDYIAPEQAAGRVVGPATDVYGLGCVLFELLTGSPPYAGSGFVDVAMKHIHSPPPDVLERRPDVPPRLAAAVTRAMAKEPGDRFPSMDAFVAELRGCLSEPEAEAPSAETTAVLGRAPAPPRRRRGPVDARPARPRRARPAALVPMLIGLAVAVALAVGLLLTQGGVGPIQGASGKKAVKLAAVASYDPQGDDGSEHPDEVGYATDGDAATYWPTSSYHYGAGSLGKDGVGIVLDARRAGEPGKIVVLSDTPGFTAEIRNGPAPEGPFDEVAAEARTVGTRTTFDTGDAKARYWLVWITNLGANSGVHVNEVRVPR